MMDQATWLAGILETISDIADKESQQRLWLSTRTDEYDSPDEIFCRFFDDYDADNFIDSYCLHSALVSREQCSMLAKFRDALNEYGEKHGEHLDPVELLADPEWHQICGMAKEIVEAFRYKKMPEQKS